MPKIQEIIEKIEVEKELLSVMPKNNHKNRIKYLEKVNQLIDEYTLYRNEVIKTLENRYKKASNIKTSKDEANLDVRIKTIEKVLYLFSEEKTSYEKMGLDKIVYKIGRYYKGNLDEINEQINEAIKRFTEVGIELKLEDFNYSIYVNQYMQVFLEEKGNTNSGAIKSKFEEVFWKCPDLIVHIELNIRNIYIKKQAQIDKYFEKEKESMLKQWNKNPKEIMNTYFELKKQKTEIAAIDKKKLFDKLMKGELNSKEYTQEKIQSNYSKILAAGAISELEKNQEEIEKGIFEFLNSLYEYKNYLEFQFIIEDIKKYYKEKDKYKKAYDEAKKQVITNENKLKKLNKKSTKKGLFSKKEKEIKWTAEQSQLIVELKKNYKDLDLNKFYNKIYSNLNDESTIYDVLKLANSYYNYLTGCMIENNNTITQEKMDLQINKLDKFLKNPYNNIINNLTILEDKDIAMIIKDRYKLLNFNIKQEDLTGKNIDNLITILENIVIGFNIKKTKINIQDVEELIKIKEALKIS